MALLGSTNIITGQQPPPVYWPFNHASIASLLKPKTLVELDTDNNTVKTCLAASKNCFGFLSNNDISALTDNFNSSPLASPANNSLSITPAYPGTAFLISVTGAALTTDMLGKFAALSNAASTDEQNLNVGSLSNTPTATQIYQIIDIMPQPSGFLPINIQAIEAGHNYAVHDFVVDPTGTTPFFYECTSAYTSASPVATAAHTDTGHWALRTYGGNTLLAVVQVAACGNQAMGAFAT